MKLPVLGSIETDLKYINNKRNSIHNCVRYVEKQELQVCASSKFYSTCNEGTLAWSRYGKSAKQNYFENRIGATVQLLRKN